MGGSDGTHKNRALHQQYDGAAFTAPDRLLARLRSWPLIICRKHHDVLSSFICNADDMFPDGGGKLAFRTRRPSNLSAAAWLVLVCITLNYKIIYGADLPDCVVYPATSSLFGPCKSSLQRRAGEDSGSVYKLDSARIVAEREPLAWFRWGRLYGQLSSSAGRHRVLRDVTVELDCGDLWRIQQRECDAALWQAPQWPSAGLQVRFVYV